MKLDDQDLLLEHEGGRTIEEIAEATGMTRYAIKKALTEARRARGDYEHTGDGWMSLAKLADELNVTGECARKRERQGRVVDGVRIERRKAKPGTRRQWEYRAVQVDAEDAPALTEAEASTALDGDTYVVDDVEHVVPDEGRLVADLRAQLAHVRGERDEALEKLDVEKRARAQAVAKIGALVDQLEGAVDQRVEAKRAAFAAQTERDALAEEAEELRAALEGVAKNQELEAIPGRTLTVHGGHELTVAQRDALVRARGIVDLLREDAVDHERIDIVGEWLGDLLDAAIGEAS